MHIKHQALAQYLIKNSPQLFILIGQDTYLINEARNTIIKSIKHHNPESSEDYDTISLSILKPDDWNQVLDESRSYSLFAPKKMIQCYYDKKSLDASGKKILATFLSEANSNCFIIVQSPDLTLKQLSSFSSDNKVLIVSSYPLNPELMKKWIIERLEVIPLHYVPNIPELIQYYTEGNMLACAQTIEKLALSFPPNSHLTEEDILEHLSDQSDHSLYELIDACLLGKTDKCLQILNQAEQNKTEPTLVLWMLAQETRALLKLHFILKSNKDFKTAATELKIWPQRVNLYQIAIKRCSYEFLERILHFCVSIDECIKSNLNHQTWNRIEELTIAIATGRLLGATCIV